VPWQPDDYVHRIGRTGRAGMKGIAITLATREDAEAIDRIEKLIGHKIPRTGASEKQSEPKKADKPQRAEKKPSRAATEARREPAPEPEAKRERSPVVEDIQSDWNGPMPSFLSVSAV